MEVKIAFSDHNKVETAFGKQEKTSLEAGIREMAEWVKEHGARESSVF
jgi:nucleoside-diphosphate-sugar epimerase